MKLTQRQAHVLANLERVVAWPYKLRTRSQATRYQLDTRDCTIQITGLIVRRLVAKEPDGSLHPTRDRLLSDVYGLPDMPWLWPTPRRVHNRVAGDVLEPAVEDR